VADIEKPLSLLRNAVHELGISDKVEFALDVAASSFFNSRQKEYAIAGQPYDVPALLSLYSYLAAKYGLLSLEDPFDEEDFAAFAAAAEKIGETLRVGDDLTTTDRERLSRAIKEKSVDALIIKPNQIGTLTETIETMKFAEENGIRCIVSHRSGETLDDFIADLAYASGAFGLKLGARGPKEREAKYARLLTIQNSVTP
jgi:enolase